MKDIQGAAEWVCDSKETVHTEKKAHSQRKRLSNGQPEARNRNRSASGYQVGAVSKGLGEVDVSEPLLSSG